MPIRLPMRPHAALAAAPALLVSIAGGQIAAPLGDLNTTPYYQPWDSWPRFMVKLNGLAYFAATGTTAGTELWRSDGTAGGTQLVRDIFPGPGGSNPRGLVVSGGKIFFWADDGFHGGQLWVSDGADTHFVQRVASGWYGYSGISGPALEPFEGGVAFISSPQSSSEPPVRRLWRSDGTEAGTYVLDQFADDWPASDEVRSFRGRLYFSAYDDEAGAELWTNDGTPGGSWRLADLWPGEPGSSAGGLTRVGDLLYFTASVDWSQRELFVTDGTAAGTRQVATMGEPGASADPATLTAFGDRLLFTASSPDSGREPYITDGTAAGTRLLADVWPGYSSGIPSTYYARFWPVGPVAYFAGTSDFWGGRLWKTDGTPQGTGRVCGNDRQLPEPFSPAQMVQLGGAVLFSASASGYATEPWRTDGSDAGTFMIEDLYPGGWSNEASSPEMGVELGGRMLMAATGPDCGRELWATDGTAAGTQLVVDLTPNPGSSYPALFTAVDDQMFFRAQDATAYGLWASDGGAPRLLLPAASTSAHFPFKHSLLFCVTTPSCDATLWRSDGTAPGTQPVRFITRVSPSYGPHGLTAVGNTVFFAAGYQGYDNVLWKTDGTEPGTIPVRLSGGGGYPLNPGSLAVWNGRLYFSGFDQAHGYELWTSDGTEAGTVMVKDLIPGPDSSGCDPIVPAGSRLFMIGHRSDRRQLWVSDGSEAGTVLVSEFPTVFLAADIRAAIGLDGVILFLYNAPDGSGQLWRSDGTEAGTFMLTTLILPPLPRWPQMKFARMADAAYFVGGTPQTGWELWKSDGSPQGTGIVRDINPGPGSAFGSESDLEMAPVGSYLYFVADDGVHGAEIWRTDGTGAGTTLYAELAPGPGGAAATHLTASGHRLYFSAFRADIGFEPWSLTIAPDCYPNCDGSADPPALNVNDFVCFLNRFAAGDPYANCDASTSSPTLDVADFVCFLNAFAAGCP